MANELFNAKNSNYNAVLKEVIKKNNELKDSLRLTKKELEEQNKAFEKLTKNLNTYITAMGKVNKNMGGSSTTNTKNLINNFVNTTHTQQQQRQNIVNSTNPLNNSNGNKNMLQLIQNSASQFKMGQSLGNQGLGALLDPKLLKAGGAVAVIGAIVVILQKMVKAGESAYKTQLNMSQSLKKLGDGSKYATTYAKQLNEELGISMDKTLKSLSDMSSILQSQGLSSEYAGKFAVNVAKMADEYSKKMGTSYTETSELYKKAIQGDEAALLQLFNVSQSTFSGWLYSVKGINQATTQLSPARLAQEYREFLEFLTDGVQGVDGATTSVARRMEEIMNKLEDMGQKLKVLFIPVFEFVVNAVSGVVDFIFDAVNSLLTFFGKEPLKLQVDTGALYNTGVEKQVKEWTKLGEQIDAAKGKLYSFDEVESQTGLLQATEEDGNFDEGTSDIATDTLQTLGADLGIDVNVEDRSLDEFKEKIKDMPTLKAIAEIRNKEEWDYLWNSTDKYEKLGAEGFSFGFKALLLGDGWGFIKGLVFGVGGVFKGLNDIQYFFKYTFTNLIFSVAQVFTSKLEEIFPKLDGLTEKIGKIKDTILGIFTGEHDFKVDLIANVSEGISSGVDSIKGFFNKSNKNVLGLDSLLDSNLFKYDDGGIALRPQIAQIGTSKGELAIPFGSSAAEVFYDKMADSIDKRTNTGPISSDSYTINIGQNSTIIGNKAELNKLADYIIDRMTTLNKQRGALNYGTR